MYIYIIYKVHSYSSSAAGQNMFRSGRMTLQRAESAPRLLSRRKVPSTGARETRERPRSCLCHYITPLWPHLPGRGSRLYLCILLKWRWLSFLSAPLTPSPRPSLFFLFSASSYTWHDILSTISVYSSSSLLCKPGNETP